MDHARNCFVPGKRQSGSAEITIMNRPTRQPVCPPARGLGGIQKGKTNSPRRIGLFDLWDLVRWFGGSDDRDHKARVVVSASRFAD